MDKPLKSEKPLTCCKSVVEVKSRAQELQGTDPVLLFLLPLAMVVVSEQQAAGVGARVTNVGAHL